MGDGACRVIDEALAVARSGDPQPVSRSARSMAPGLLLSTGEQIAAATIVWCAGMRANPLTERFPAERDRFGRVPVDRFMQVEGMKDIFAAGDAACAIVDDRHSSVMSCQHARPMGRFAGHNVVCDLLGRPMLPLRIDWYTTILDLGPWGAVYTEGEETSGPDCFRHRSLGTRGTKVANQRVRNANGIGRACQCHSVGDDDKCRALMQKDKLGTIAPGAYADMLVVEGNPLSDLQVMLDPQSNLKLVMKDGVIYKNELS